MRISEMQRYLNATLEKFGDLECLLDFDPEAEDIYEIEGIFCDVNPDDETDVQLVFSTFPVRQALKAVK